MSDNKFKIYVSGFGVVTEKSNPKTIEKLVELYPFLKKYTDGKYTDGRGSKTKDKDKAKAKDKDS